MKQIEKLQIFDLIYFLYKNSFGDDGFQNMFGYQPTFEKLELQEDNGAEYGILGN